MTKGQHRIVAGTKRARQGIAMTSQRASPHAATAEQRAWNEKVDADRAAQAQRKADSRNKGSRK